MERFNELVALKDGWFFAEGVKIKKKSLILAKDCLENVLLKIREDLPKIFPMLNGTIRFEYLFPKKTVEIVFDEDRVILTISHRSQKEDQEIILKSDLRETLMEVLKNELK